MGKALYGESYKGKKAEMGRKPVNWNSLGVRVVEGKFCKPEQSDIYHRDLDMHYRYVLMG